MIPRSMQAAILAETGGPLLVDEVKLPDELGFGQALVRVHFSGVCGSQLGEIAGVKGTDHFLPHLLGHEASGVVEGIGPGVKLVRPGDHVVLHWMKGDGIEADPPSYRWHGERLNAGWVTTFNEYAIVSENRLTPIPKEIDLDVAALFGCAVTTGLGVIANDAQLRIGESVVVFGAGGVGINVIQGAALASAHPIVAVDLVEARLDVARQFGASHCLLGGRLELEAELRDSLSGGADVVVETTGARAVIELAYSVAGPSGRVVLVGVPKATEAISIHSLPLHFGKRLVGSHGGDTHPSRDIPRYLRLYQAGKLRLRDMIGCCAPLEAINSVIDGMRGGMVGRPLIDMAPRSGA
jgi:S-(hydroxymethyl)glutathione dehydrogenase / alcohol dehydrogenase